MTVQVVLSVIEILLLVLVLAYFLRRLTQLLAKTGDTLDKIGAGVRAVEEHCTIIGPGADQINGLLTEAAGSLEQAALATEQLASSSRSRR